MNESYKTFNDFYDPVNSAAKNYYDDSTYNSNYNPATSASEYEYDNVSSALGFMTCGGILPGGGSSNDTSTSTTISTFTPDMTLLYNYSNEYYSQSTAVPSDPLEIPGQITPMTGDTVLDGTF